MTSLDSLYEEVVAFYRGWNELETSGVYADGQPILDHDNAPPQHHGHFNSRREVLTVLSDLRRCLGEHADVHPVVQDNLVASEAYLRATLGERLSFRDYVSALYHYHPAPIPSRTLEATAAKVRSLCQHFGLMYRAEDRAAYLDRFRVESPEEVAALACASQDYWLERLYTHVQRPEELKIKVEVVQKDEPWSFFLSGGAGLMTFSINAHPRHTFTRGQCEYIASHEIAGHAVQNSLWAKAITQQGLPIALQIWTTHHPIVPLTEGLAQALPYLLCQEPELGAEMMLAKTLRELRDMALANAQLMLEDSSPVTAAWEYCADRLLFVQPFEIERDLTNRMLKPSERAYQHCYSPSFLAFLGVARRLHPDDVGAFLRSQYQQIPSAREFWRHVEERPS